MKRTLFSIFGLPALILMLSLTTLTQANADEVIFEFPTNGANGAAFDFNSPTGSFTDTASSLIANFSAVVAGNTGDLNATTSSFGINATGVGDDSDGLDAANGAESIVITFGGPVSATLTEVDLGVFTAAGADAGTIDIGGVSTALASTNTRVIPVHSELVGNTLTITGTAGNGFSLDSLTFHVKPVPEPGSLAMLGLGSVLMMARRRRRR